VMTRRRRRRVKRRIQSEIMGCGISFFFDNKENISPSNHCFHSGTPPPNVTRMPPPIHALLNTHLPLTKPLRKLMIQGAVKIRSR